MHSLHSNNVKIAELLESIHPLLALDGVDLTDERIRLLDQHVELVREWNHVVGVVSGSEVERLWERHVVDSLSLAAVVNRLRFGEGHLVDVGSGGGFPAIPMKVVLPGLCVALVERSVRKVGFLRKVIAALQLTDISVVVGEFPRVALDGAVGVITARAVESPERTTPRILDVLGEGAVFLSQSGLDCGSGYAVERIADRWTELGLRRGTLDLVRRVG